jgi:cytochrome o ubiquinol oxidase subunit II
MRGKKKSGKGRPIWFVVLILIALAALVTTLLQGTDVALFKPKGIIADEQRRLMVHAVIILLEIAIPTLAAFYFIAWKYRESNQKATHDPKLSNDKSTVFVFWAIPIIFMLVLTFVMWPATHKLAPYKQIYTDVEPLTIQVVALRWKWLFIYPKQNVASVNFVQIPVNKPVQFELTADDTPMSSFWIPHLGGQLYAMTGHVNRLNLMAETAGDFAGSTAEINGAGFADMKFIVRASTENDFDNWINSVKLSTQTLDSETYQKLVEPSRSNRASFYSETEANLYANILFKYNRSHGQHTEQE